MRETEHENEQTTERVIQDRQYQIDGVGKLSRHSKVALLISCSVVLLLSNLSGYCPNNEGTQDAFSFVTDIRVVSAGECHGSSLSMYLVCSHISKIVSLCTSPCCLS